MIRPWKSKRLVFEKAMEINGISPLPHYYEEIYANQIGLPAIGIRGDKNYLFYSQNGLGEGYYEKTEKLLAADATYAYFQDLDNKEKFLKGVSSIIRELQDMTKRVNKMNLEKFNVKELAQLFLEANELHGKIFSYYIVSQPYRMQKFESEIASELAKRVATSRVDHYMTILSTSGQKNKMTQEESEWLDLVIKYKSKYPSLTLRADSLEKDFPNVYADLDTHYESYKILTLGDGNWKYDINVFLRNFINDYHKDLEALKKRRNDIYSNHTKAREYRDKLIKDLYLDKSTISNINFLSKMGHSRLTMRVEGWMPFVLTVIKIDIALSIALNQSTDSGGLLNFMEPSEILKLSETGQAVNDDVLIQRKGSRQEFMILHDNGKYRMFYGSKAGTMFKKLVPPIDHESTLELRGSTAVRGKIIGTACVYKWGDDIEKKQKIIQKNQILIAGQTRPAMMPIIRLAKGIVTDEGGVTSHAAIVSRELGIPSVIGTVHATQVFKDGDRVELDADNGIVRKLS